MRVCGVPVLAILLLASAGVSAQTTPDTPEQSADRALAAFRAGVTPAAGTTSPRCTRGGGRRA
jgi:hypothetical protein